MPKSRRDKKISLTKTGKKGLELKQKIVEDVKRSVKKFGSVYVFSYINMRSVNMKEVREEWKPSRFYFGKNRIIGIGLGRTKEEEAEEGLHNLSGLLKGQCAVLFTNKDKKEVTDWFNEFSYPEFARSGFVSETTIELKQGPLTQFSHSMEPYLRTLGLPTKLDKGTIQLLQDYEVCKEGSTLTPEQAKILQLFEYKLATFKFILKACWVKGEGFEKFDTDDTKDELMEDEEAEDDE